MRRSAGRKLFGACVFLALAAYVALRQSQSHWWLISAMRPLPFMYLVIQYGLQKSDIPKLKELESLQRKFSEDPPTSR